MSKTCCSHGPAPSHQHSTRQRALSPLFPLLLNTVFSFKQGQFEKLPFLKRNRTQSLLERQAEDAALRAASEGRNGEPTCQDAGSSAAGALLCFISHHGDDRAGELPFWSQNSQSISQKSHVGPRKTGTGQEIKDKTQDYLF